MKRTTFYSILLFFLLTNCDKDEPIELKSIGGFPLESINFAIVNSKYDDYNSDFIQIPGEYDLITFVFSSNRKSKGHDFDFIMYSLSMSYPFDKNIVTIKEFPGQSNLFAYLDYKMPSINSKNNEFGPYLLTYHVDKYNSDDYLFFYTQEINSRCILRFNRIETTQESKIYNPYLNIINSNDYNVGYISIQNEKIYYNCDIDGNYDIYELAIDTTMDLFDFITQKNNMQSQAKKIIGSSEDDKCPFVLGNFMVFSSKRNGGYGGFDLWYSTLKDTTWCDPINFGAQINSSADEFRPVLIKYKDIPNDLMIFSSNRSGGYGGFDLYYVGITQTK